MENIIVVFGGLGFFIFFDCEWILSGETVVGFSDNIRVTNGPASILGIEGN